MSGERNSFDNFEELYTNCYWLVYRYVRHMVEKDLAAAEDVTQEVFLVAYQKWQEVRRHPNQKGFLLLTAKNKLKKWYEQQGKIQTEGPGQEEKAARRPDSGQEGYYVQAEWNAFLEQIFSSVRIRRAVRQTYLPLLGILRSNAQSLEASSSAASILGQNHSSPTAS